MSADFPNYLQSVCDTYQRWWRLYTITDVEGSKTAQRQEMPLLFDFGLMVETVQAKQQERGETPDKTEQETERLPVQEGIRKYANNHVLLVGRPGSGKSTALARLLLEEAENSVIASEAFAQGVRRTQRNEAISATTAIPILLQLRNYGTNDNKSVLDIIQNFLLHHDPSLTFDRETLKTWLRQGQFLLLLDGVNELPNEEARRDLKTFRQNYPHTPMIFSTRDLGVGGDLGIEKKLEMQPLTEGQMQQFVRAYLPEQGEEMLRRLGGRLREFGQTPLLLWMLCELFRTTGNVPPNLGLVFRYFARSYDSKIKDDVPVSGESRRWWQELLQHLAFAMMQGETPTELRVTIDRREAEAIFEKFLQGKVDYPPTRAKEWLEDLLKHHLIQVASNEKIEFRHQLLQEYYAAECLLQQLPNISNDKLKRDYLNYLKWTEPLALMLALVEKEAQAVRVVELALDVDLALGARLAGKVKPEFQEKTVGLILGLDIHKLVKIEFLGITHSDCAIAILCDSLDDKDSSVRRSAAYTLGRIGNPSTVNALIQALNDENSDIFGSAAYGLGEMRNKSAFITLKEALNNEKYSAVLNSAYALGEISNSLTVDTRHDLSNEKYSAVLNSAYALEKSSNSSTVDALQDLNDEKSTVRMSAASTLGKIGNLSAVNALIQALNDEKSTVRRSAASALGKIGNLSAVNALIQALNDEKSTVRRSAASALGKIGNLSAVNALIQALNDEKSTVRRSAASALGKIGNSSAVDALIEALNDEHFLVRGSVAHALGKIGNYSELDALIQTLNDKDSSVRRSAASALGEIGNPLAVDALIETLNDKDSSVRRSAASALGEIGNPLAVDALIETLNDKEFKVRRSAASALGKIGNPSATDGLIEALNDKDCSVRTTAASALGEIGNPSAVDALVKALNDKEFDVRRSATSALGEIASSELLPRMWDLLLTNTEYYTRKSIYRIQARYKFYNHKIFHSSPIEEKTKTQSEISKSSTYIFHQPVGNLNTGDVNIHGNQVGIEHNPLNNKD